MTPRKGAGKALRLNLPGAPETWHYIPGVPGLYHPILITPYESVGLDAQSAQVLHDDESMHLEFADATEEQIKAANADLARASQDALTGVRSALPHRETSEERDRILASAKAAQAVNTPDNTSKEG